jgi:hypothetical protein
MEKRKYIFVPYQLMGIQQGIQGGHASDQYAHKYKDDSDNIDFVENHMTWIVLNGGSTNNRRDFTGKSVGTLNQIADQLLEHDIKFTHFIEPDLNDALTAVCFICDERVFNKELYPDFTDFMANEIYPEIVESDLYSDEDDFIDAKLNRDYEVYKYKNRLKFQNFSKMPEYKEWIEFIGGEKNLFLRNLIKDKKLA